MKVLYALEWITLVEGSPEHNSEDRFATFQEMEDEELSLLDQGAIDVDYYPYSHSPS